MSRGLLKAGLLWESGLLWLSEPYEVAHKDSQRVTTQYREGCRHVTVTRATLRSPGEGSAGFRSVRSELTFSQQIPVQDTFTSI